MSKYSLQGVVLLLSANRFIETTPNLCYGEDCHAAAAVFIPTNSNCFHFVIWQPREFKYDSNKIKLRACYFQQNELRFKKH